MWEYNGDIKHIWRLLSSYISGFLSLHTFDVRVISRLGSGRFDDCAVFVMMFAVIDLGFDYIFGTIWLMDTCNQ